MNRISIKGFSQQLPYIIKLLKFYSDKLDKDKITTIKEIGNRCGRVENLIKGIIKTTQLESANIEFKSSIEDLAFLIKITVNRLKVFAESLQTILLRMEK